MGYLVNQARVATLTINGADYTSSLIQWVVSDSSAVSNGLISTSGSMTLQGIPGGALMQDYDRSNFKRGAEVILSLKKQDGNVVRHPRGLLYVVSMVYDPETETLTVSLGCRIALAILNSDTSSLLAFAPIPLDVTQQTVQGVGGSLNAAGMYLFQDNTGTLVSGKVFGTDSPVSTEQGEWTSVLGLTAVSVKPLAGAEIVPDTVSVSYQTPSSYSDGPANVDIQ